MEHLEAYPDLYGEDPNEAPDWLKTIVLTDGVVVLSEEQTDIARRNNAASHDPGPTAQRKYAIGGIDAVREWLFQKSRTDDATDRAVKLAASDSEMARVVEGLFELIEKKFPGEAKATVGAEGVAKINRRRALRGQVPL